jgi:4'-phosphopantetheinyl transferase
MRGHVDVWLVPREADNAHSAMRAVLSEYTGISPEDLGFERQCAACGSREHGKPRLTSGTQGRPPLFSLARNHRFVAIAVCADREIGVDLEDSQEAPPATYSWCHPNEAQKLSSLPPARREAAALRLWVRREAVLKAMGLGLGEDADGLDLSGLPARFTGWTCATPTWQVTDVGNADELIISLAATAASTVTLRRRVRQPCSLRSLESQRVNGDVSQEGC